MEWVSLRGRKEDHYRTDRKPETLSLNGAGLLLETSSQPTVVFHRQQHFEFVAEVLIDFPSTGPEGSAGLTVFYDQEHHYDFRITRAGSGLCLELYRRIGDLAAVTHRCPLDTGPWRLQVRGNRHFYSFSRAVRDGWEELGTGRIEYVCTEATPVSFTGVMIGLFSESQRAGESWADFREFSYRPEKA
jgi:alpha-N-arabinofuranosidase